MALVALTNGNTEFYLDENNIIRVYSKNSETKVQYIDVELGVVKIVTVVESVSVVGGSSNLLIALTETASGSTFYLNSGMISLVTTNASGSLVRFDYNGQQLQIQVDESDVSVLTPSTPAAYKIYKALLTQTGTNAPTAIVLENTLGITPAYGYTDVGTYSLTSIGSFPDNKTIFTGYKGECQYFGGALLLEKKYTYGKNDEDSLYILSDSNDSLANDLLDGWLTYIKIIVYP